LSAGGRGTQSYTIFLFLSSHPTIVDGRTGCRCGAALALDSYTDIAHHYTASHRAFLVASRTTILASCNLLERFARGALTCAGAGSSNKHTISGCLDCLDLCRCALYTADAGVQPAVDTETFAFDAWIGTKIRYNNRTILRSRP